MNKEEKLDKLVEALQEADILLYVTPQDCCECTPGRLDITFRLPNGLVADINGCDAIPDRTTTQRKELQDAMQRQSLVDAHRRTKKEDPVE